MYFDCDKIDIITTCILRFDHFTVTDPSSCTLERMQRRVRDVGNSVGDSNLELSGCLDLCESSPECQSFVYIKSRKLCQMKDKVLMGYEDTIRDPDSFTVYKKCDVGMFMSIIISLILNQFSILIILINKSIYALKIYLF